MFFLKANILVFSSMPDLEAWVDHSWYQSLVNAKGLQNPEGMGQGYVRVRVRVQNSEPSTNPYP